MEFGVVFLAGCLLEGELNMSYILDALKKIEHEKNSKTRAGGRLNITGDLFVERQHHSPKDGVWRLLLLVAAASLFTFAVTWFVFRGKGQEKVTAAVPTVIAPSPVIVPPVKPVQMAPAVNTPAVQEMKPPPAVNEVSQRQLKQSVQLIQAPADIKLAGIAWQDEHSARRAVINGFLLKEGAQVSGAKIVDIQTDRVRFSSANGIFEIRLDALSQPEVKR